MAINTLAQLRSGTVYTDDIYKTNANNPEQAGIWLSYYNIAFKPSVGPTITGTPAGEDVAKSTHAGSLYFPDPSSGLSYLNYFTMMDNIHAGGFPCPPTVLFVCDRLWQTQGITTTITTEQTIDSGVFLARDKNGTTDGEDVLVGLEVVSGTGNLGVITNTTLKYTNSAGTDTRTGTISSFPVTCNHPSFVPFELAAGDKGVRSIQSITLGTSYVSGTIALVAFRVVAMLMTTPGVFDTSVVQTGISLGKPVIYNDSYLFLIRVSYNALGTTQNLQGTYSITQG